MEPEMKEFLDELKGLLYQQRTYLDNNRKKDQDGSPSSPSQFSGSFKRLADEGDSLVDMFIKGQGGLSEFTGMVSKLIPDKLAFLGKSAVGTANYIENAATAFRILSKTGLSYEGNLQDLIKATGNSFMTLENFTSLLSNNSQILARFANGVDGGTTAFSEYSNAMMQSKNIEYMERLGYSVDEANEFLLKNIQLTQRQSRIEGMDAKAVSDLTRNYAKDLAVISRLTGKRADQVQEEMIQQKMAGDVQAKIRLMEMDGAKNASAVYDEVTKNMQGLPKEMQGLYNELFNVGTAVSGTSQQMTVMHQEAAQYLMEAVEAGKRDDVQGAIEASKKARQSFLNSSNSRTNLILSSTGALGGIMETAASSFQQMVPLLEQVEDYVSKLDDTIKPLPDLGTALGNILDEYYTTVNKQMTSSEPKLLDLPNVATRLIRESGSNFNKGIADMFSPDNIGFTRSAIEESLSLLDTALSTAANTLGNLPSIINNITNPITSEELGNIAGQAQGQTITLPNGNQLTLSPEIVNDIKTLAQTADKNSEQARILQEKLFNEGILIKTKDGKFLLNSETAAIIAQTAYTTSLQPGTEGSMYSQDENGAQINETFNPIVQGIQSLLNYFDISARAKGGPVSANEPYIVGEEGPELFVPKNKGFIMPNENLEGMIQPSIIDKKLSNKVKTDLENIKSNIDNIQKTIVVPNDPSRYNDNDKTFIMKTIQRELMQFGEIKNAEAAQFATENKAVLGKIEESIGHIKAGNNDYGNEIMKTAIDAVTSKSAAKKEDKKTPPVKVTSETKNFPNEKKEVTQNKMQIEIPALTDQVGNLSTLIDRLITINKNIESYSKQTRDSIKGMHNGI